jgi:hypothetical protein
LRWIGLFESGIVVLAWSPYGHQERRRKFEMAEASVKLTKRAVDGAAPKSVRYLLWDTELKGFGLRVAETGTKTYIVRYRPRGIGPGAPKRFVVLGRHGSITPDEARSRAKTLLGVVSAGEDPANDRKAANAGITIVSLVELFLAEHVTPNGGRLRGGPKKLAHPEIRQTGS